MPPKRSGPRAARTAVSPPVAPTSPRNRARLESRWLLLLVLVLAAVLRVGHVLALRHSPWFDYLMIDPQYYDEWAGRIAAGEWLGDRPFYMDPLYPYFLGVTYKVFGRDLLLVRLLQVGLSLVSCALLARLGERCGGPGIGLLAALGFALYEPEIFYVAEIDKTCLSVLLTSAFLVLTLGRTLSSRLGAGVALGLAALTRANLLLFAPVAGVVFLLSRDGRTAGASGVPRSVAGAALFAVGLGLSLGPAFWRNHHVSGDWVLTTVQAGQNFYIGNNPLNPYGGYGLLPFVRANPHFEEVDFHNEAEARVGRELSAGEVSRFWFAQAAQHMRAEPAFALRALLRKAALFWNDFEISDNQDQYILARHSWVMRLPLLGFGCIAPLALLGAVVGFRARSAVRLLCGFVLLYSASVVAFFMFSRYRIQVVPALLPLAAIGAVEWGARLRAAEWRRAAAATAIVAGAAWFCFQTIGNFSRADDLFIEMQLGHLGTAYVAAGQPDQAIPVFQEALEHCPTRCPQPLEDLFNLYLNTGRLAEGEAYFRAFTTAHPDHEGGRRFLAQLLAAGRHDGAGTIAP